MKNLLGDASASGICRKVNLQCGDGIADAELHPDVHNFAAIATAMAALVCLVASPDARAATYYWDNNGTTAGFGTAGGNLWTVPTTNQWSTDSTGVAAPGASVTTSTGDSLYLGTDASGLAAGTVTVSGTQNAAHLYFGKASGAITLNGASITFPAGGTSNIKAMTGAGAATGTHTINSNISKPSGTVSIGRQNTSGEHYIFNGVISGGVGLDLRPQNNAAYIAFNGVNTFSGNPSLVTGQLNVNSVADSGVASSIGTGSVLSMGGGGGQSPLLWYTGAGAGSMNRTVRSTASGDNRIVAQDGALTLSGPLTTTGGGSYNFGLSGTADTGVNTVSGVISDGSGTIIVTVKSATPQGGSAEDGHWTLSGVNTYTGNTTVNNGGTLVIGGVGQLGSGSYGSTLSINNTGTFIWDSSASQTLTGTVQGSGSGGLVASGSGQLSIDFTSANTTFSGPVSVDGGNLRFNNTSDLQSFSANALTIENGGQLVIRSVVGGSNRTVLNNKTWTFDNIGGSLLFNQGNHLFQGGGSTHNFVTTASGSGSAITSTGGGFMNMQGSGNIIFTIADGAQDQDLDYAAIWSNGLLTKNGAGTLAFTGSHGGSYPVVINAGTLEIGGAAALAGGTFSSTIANGGSLVYASSADQTLSGVISGSGGFTKRGSSTLTLSGNNTQSGSLSMGHNVDNVTAGTVALQHSSALGTKFVSWENDGTLILDASGLTITSGMGVYVRSSETTGLRTLRLDRTGTDTGTWSGNIDIRFGSAFRLDVGTNDTLTLGGTLSTGAGTGGFTKIGAGTLVVNGNNTYSGNTTINAGTVQMGHNAAFGGTGQGTVVASGGALDMASFDPTAGENFTISGMGTDGAGGVGVLHSTVNSSSIDGASTITLAADTEIGGGGGRIDSWAAVTGGGFDLTKLATDNFWFWGGTASDIGSLIADTGAGMYIGNTAVADAATNVHIKSSAFLMTWGTGQVFTSPFVFENGSSFMNNWNAANASTHEMSGDATLNGTVTFAANSNVGVNRVTTLSGAVDGAGGLTKTGYHTLVLSSSNTYAGATAVDAGTVIVADSSALGSAAGSTTVASGAKLHLDSSGGDLTLAEAISLGGGGSGVLRNLAGDNVLSGLVTLTAGCDLRRDAGSTTFSGGISSANHGVSMNGLFHLTNTAVNLGSGGMNYTSNGNNPATDSRIDVAGNVWGTTTINFGGYVTLGVDDGLPTDTSLEFGWTTAGQSSGTLDLNGHDQEVGSMETRSTTLGDGGDHKVTGGGTLTVNQTSGTEEFQGRITDGSSVTALTKSGAGTLLLNNLTGTADSYTGDTTVDGGVLQLAVAATLDATSTVRISSPGSLQLDANQTVDALYINGTQMWPSTWGATGSGAISIDDVHFSGTGILTVSDGPMFPGTLIQFK